MLEGKKADELPERVLGGVCIARSILKVTCDPVCFVNGVQDMAQVLQT